jgi:hypothetical protein
LSRWPGEERACIFKHCSDVRHEWEYGKGIPVTPTANIAEFFERIFAIELGAAGLFARLAARLDRLPELAALVRGLEENERASLKLLRSFRDSLPPAVLEAPCAATVIRQLDRAAGLLEGDPASRFVDFEEAYEFIHEFENNEVLPLLRLLEGECRTERLDCSAINMVVEQSLSRLDSVAASAGDRALRRAMRL